MNKNLKKILSKMTLFLFFTTAISTCNLTHVFAKNSDDIDKNIYNLSYDPKKILSYNGESIENFIPAESCENSNKFIVIKREKKSVADSTADISIIDSMNDKTYPGRSEEHTSELQSRQYLVCRLLLEKKKR